MISINTPLFPILTVAIATGLGALLLSRFPTPTAFTQRPLLVVGVGGIAIWLYFLRYHSGHVEGGMHIGFYGNAVWNLADGAPYHSDWFGNILGYHALFSGIWFYLPALIPHHPLAFTGLHTFYVASGAVAYAALAQHLTKRGGITIAVGILFLLNPYVTGWFWNEFTVYSLVFPLLPAAFLAAERGRPHIASALALVVGLLIEDLGIGLLLVWAAERFRARRLFPHWYGFVQGGLLLFYFLVLKPSLPAVGSESQHLSPLLASGDIEALFEGRKVGFLLHTILGTAGLCWFAPLPLLITVADVALALVSPTHEVHLINSPYLPALASGVLLSAVYGVSSVHRRYPSLSRTLAPGLLVWAVCLPLTYNHSIYAVERAGVPRDYVPRPVVLDIVPVGATVATNDPIFYGWGYDRRIVYLDERFFPWMASSSRTRASSVEWLVLDRSRGNSGREDLERILASGTHEIVAVRDSHVYAQRAHDE